MTLTPHQPGIKMGRFTRHLHDIYTTLTPHQPGIKWEDLHDIYTTLTPHQLGSNGKIYTTFTRH